MRIGLVAPPWLPVPPTSYGGTEAVIDNLARGLTTLGHDVQLFTVGTSTCPVAREHLFAEPAPEMGMALPEAAHALAAYDALRDVDVIHDHTVLGAVLHRTDRSRAGHAHVVVTYHHPYTPAATKVLASRGDSAALVAISGHPLDPHAACRSTPSSTTESTWTATTLGTATPMARATCSSWAACVLTRACTGPSGSHTAPESDS